MVVSEAKMILAPRGEAAPAASTQRPTQPIQRPTQSTQRPAQSTPQSAPRPVQATPRPAQPTQPTHLPVYTGGVSPLYTAAKPSRLTPTWQPWERGPGMSRLPIRRMEPAYTSPMRLAPPVSPQLIQHAPPSSFQQFVQRYAVQPPSPRPASTYTPAPPGVQQVSPSGVHQASPSGIQQVSGVQQASPGMQHASPGFQQVSPGMQAASSGVQPASPKTQPVAAKDSSKQIDSWPTDARSTNSSASFRYSSSTDSSSSCSEDTHAAPTFVGTWVPLKGDEEDYAKESETPAKSDGDATPSADEPWYLDPGSQKFISLSQWVAKHGEQPRETLRKGASLGRVKRPTLSEDSGGWPVSVESPVSPESALSRHCAFADQVALQNKLLAASRQDSLLSTGDTMFLECPAGEFPSMLNPSLETPSPASPNPEPSGPSDLGDCSAAGSVGQPEGDGDGAAFSLLGSAASFTDNLNEDSTRAAMEEAQRQRGLAAKLTVINHVLSRKEEDVRAKTHAERTALEAEIAHLRAEAELFRLKAEEEQRKREEERLENIAKLEALKAEASRQTLDPQIHEMLQKQEQMQQIIEKMMRANKLVEEGVEYIPHERHGITAVQFQILRCGPLAPNLTEGFQGSILPYAIVKVGNSSLTSRLEYSMSLTELRERQDFTWNDLFIFPYLNERFLSVTLRLKENRSDNRQYDHLLGSARIDLEVFIINSHMCGSQLVQLFDEKGRPTVPIQVGIQTSSEVTQCAFLATKPKEMTPSDVALTQTLTSAYFDRSSNIFGTDVSITGASVGDVSVTDIPVTESPVRTLEANQAQASLTRSVSHDSLTEVFRAVDFRALGVVAHNWRSLRILIVGVRGIKLGNKTPDTIASVRSTLLSTNQPMAGQVLLSSSQPIRVTQLKKKRLFATATFNEECIFPYSMEKLVLFEFLNHTQRDDDSGLPAIIGSCQLSLQKLLMTKLSWFKRRLCIEKLGSQRRVGYLDVIVQFLPDSVTACGMAPSLLPIDNSFYTSGEPSTYLSDHYGFEHPSSFEDVENRDAQLRLAAEAAENLPSPRSCQVTVEMGRDLRNPSIRQLEPYVKVKLGNFEAKTGIATSNCPRWKLRDGQFAFNLDRDWETHLLTLECYHNSRTGRDKLVGITLLPLADLKSMPSRYFNGEVSLLDKLCRVSGFLQVTVQLSC
eukprot:Gregarina_sp_Poly_1__9534@NODE_5_length_25086_cov_86_244454_g4_i0_p3_GENE_NODE_5_length_25086_cov_86_244454_g4_i0NODE_5_length_25086_cov_86_244454_g4_i0_p3_ORF_typecomplete_len1176_score212_09C2/PF00168_30/0_021C2/PF00168_30/0_17C2/PF00168_30/4_9e09HAUS5/PF14817_6/0_00011SMC_N/PF02463_19/0_0007C2C2_1/PF11618_8/7_3e03C2C2_1/PF11618_8/17C2C2_1/PF11618_8/32TMEM247/PF15444_6/0_28SecA_PP_bind/PF01043_20/0_74FapA/PF03961_13/1_6Mcm10/PF09332_11/3_4DUF3584/PF12128_8/3_4DUF812/PF05667_11/4_3FUSC/PF04632_